MGGELFISNINRLGETIGGKMEPQNGYLWVKPIQEESVYKVDQEDWCFVELLKDDIIDSFNLRSIEKNLKLIVKNLELYNIKEEKYYFVHRDNVVAIYEPPA